MWAPSAEYKIVCLCLSDACPLLPGTEKGTSKAKFSTEDTGFGYAEFITVPALRASTAGWLLNDTLVLRFDVVVEREDRFHLDTGPQVLAARALDFTAGFTGFTRTRPQRSLLACSPTVARCAPCER
ncbi:hypothetical protein FOA52_010592 [Chlamydomonas sp. UWO 241]|nr:hypothetical protein FOA52_010592 [Chlamydomonas sp. UWO 241]